MVTMASDDGAVGDLTPLVWGNWMTDQTVHGVGGAANPSINVPAYGADQVGTNMDKPSNRYLVRGGFGRDGCRANHHQR